MHGRNILSMCAAALMIFAVVMGAEAVGPDALRSGFEDTDLPRNDDGYTPSLSMGFTINFFGTNYGSVYVNNNGNVTFDGGMYN